MNVGDAVKGTYLGQDYTGTIKAYCIDAIVALDAAIVVHGEARETISVGRWTEMDRRHMTMEAA